MSLDTCTARFEQYDQASTVLTSCSTASAIPITGPRTISRHPDSAVLPSWTGSGVERSNGVMILDAFALKEDGSLPSGRLPPALQLAAAQRRRDDRQPGTRSTGWGDRRSRALFLSPGSPGYAV